MVVAGVVVAAGVVVVGAVGPLLRSEHAAAASEAALTRNIRREMGVIVQVCNLGHAGENGLGYLEKHGVAVQTVEGPKDPRLAAIAQG